MSLIVNGIEEASPVENQLPVATGPRLWLIVPAVLSFPFFGYGLAYATDDQLLGGVSIFFALLLGMYVYRGMAELAATRNRIWVITLIILSIAVATLVAPNQMVRLAVANTLTVCLAGAVIGRRSLRDHSQTKVYVIGLGIVLIGGVVMFQPHWSGMIEVIHRMGTDISQNAKPNLVTLGYSEVEATALVEQMTTLFGILARLIPGVVLMYLLMQYSVGFLWFMAFAVPAGTASGQVRPITSWKMPFALMPFLIVVLTARLLGGETVKLVSDNLLAMLSIWYCVGGLALLEFGLQRIRVNVGVRIAIYLLILLSGLLGYFILVLAGFVDSFADWRKRIAVSDLDKNE